MASNKTVVKGVRASQEFFDKCDLVAKNEGIDRNKLIVRCVEEYLDKFEWLEAVTLDGCLSYICGVVKNNDRN